MNQPRTKRLTPQQAREKIYRFCAYQERCHQEVKNKLYEYGLYTSDVDDLLAHLVTEGFLNEERFARAFAGGKFRIKRWGRQKIVRELEAKGLTKNCIRMGLQEIDDEAYQKTLRELIEKKRESLTPLEPNIFRLHDKIATYVIRKGYEPDLVWQVIKEES